MPFLITEGLVRDGEFYVKKDEFFGDLRIHKDAFVSSAAFVTGAITIMEKVIIAPQASLRADEGSPFFIDKGSNLQDGVTLHGLLDKRFEVNGELFSIHIGSHCSLAHGALVHGPCTVGKKSFVGFYAIVHNARIGRNCFIHHHALVEGVVIPDNTYVPRGSIVASQYDANKLPRIPRRVDEPRDPIVPEAAIIFNEEVVDYNKELCGKYSARRSHLDGLMKK